MENESSVPVFERIFLASGGVGGDAIFIEIKSTPLLTSFQKETALSKMLRILPQ